MPNQYTKFQAALQRSEPPEFRWRECTGNKKTRPRQKQCPKSSSPSTRSSTTEHATYPRGLSSPSTLVSNTLRRYLPSSGLRIDPFRSFPVNPDHAELAVLDHFLHSLAPSGNYNYTPTLNKKRLNHIDPHVELLLPYVMQEPPLFDAMLATCQASIALCSGLSASNDRFFMQHRGRAMSGLRGKLENQIDVSAMLAVTMLITCDYLVGDTKAVLGHVKALHRMINLRGELPDETPWDKFIKAGVNAYKTIGYVATGTCLEAESLSNHLDLTVDPFLVLDYPQPPFSSKLCIRWSKLPSGFSDLILESQISTQLVAIICALDDIEVDEDELTDTLAAIRPIQAALKRFSQHNQATYLERCVAAGILAYTFQYPRLQVPNLFHDPPMQGFIRLFSVPYRTQSNSERDLLVWAQVVIESFASARPSRLPGSRAIFNQAITKFGVMKEWLTLEKVLNRFPFTPQLRERWKICHAQYHLSPTAGLDSSRDMQSIHRYTTNPFSNTEEALSVCPFSGHARESEENNTPQCPFRPASPG